MRLVVIAFVVVVGGCCGCAPGLRGDGSLAVLEISDKLHQLRYEPTTTTYGFGEKTWSVSHPGGDMIDAFCAGAHLWDVVGAQVRCRREVEGQHAVSSIGVVLADGWENPGAAAWWSIVEQLPVGIRCLLEKADFGLASSGCARRRCGVGETHLEVIGRR
jgi:hypothetical protein